MKNTAFDPYDWGKYNMSIDTLMRCVRENGWDIYPFQEALGFSSKARSIKIIHLNWFENLSGRNKISIYTRFVKKLLFLSFFVLSGKKIIWSMHNRRPHEVKSKFLSSILVDILVKYTHKIMIYSEYSREILNSKYKNIDSKIIRVPHPNFIGDYGEIQETKEGPKLRLLFLGETRPYKNIELLIDVLSNFEENEVELTVAGKISSSEYEKEILDKTKNRNNINFKFGFVDDKDIPHYLAKCDLVVLPYNILSSLNSGSAILAFSYAKTVICPYIGTIMDLENKDKILYYDYENHQDHHEVLKKIIQKAIDLKKENADVYVNWGNALYKEMELNYSKEKTKKALKKLYDI